jgi:hypothetical protein
MLGMIARHRGGCVAVRQGDGKERQHTPLDCWSCAGGLRSAGNFTGFEISRLSW